MVDVKYYPDPCLREKSELIKKVTQEERNKIDGMLEFMYANGSVGLSAPQIGWNVRVIVIDPAGQRIGRTVFLNPKYRHKSSKMVDSSEGCVSLPGIVGKVQRHKNITISAYGLDGKKLILPFSGFSAMVWQHELDHLDGKLFIDLFDDLSQIKDKLEYLESLQEDK